MSKNIGCVGCGNMGGAIILGLMENLAGRGHLFHGCNRSQEKMVPLREKGLVVQDSALSLARQCDIIFLAVKPHQAEAVIASMLPALDQDKLLVSIVAGLSLPYLRGAVQGRCPVVRCMPNTPALVGSGVFACCFDADVEAEDKAHILEIFSALGLCMELSEDRFPAFTALIGAGPAYVFAMMQALVQAGVTMGFRQSEARQMVTALFAGSALLASRSAAPLIQLRDDVCSPGGLTIAGVNQLDRAGMTGILLDAVLAAEARGREMES